MNKKTLKKQEIIKKSIHVMHEKGYNGTGVKQLTDAAGIPKGSLYNYFENKEDYAKEALYFYHNEMGKVKLDILADENLRPLDRIKNFYEVMIEEEVKCKLGCFVGNITQEMSGVNEGIQGVTGEIYKDIVERIKNCLLEAKEQGDLPKEKNIDVFAEFIVSSWQGALLTSKASNKKEQLDNFYKVLVEVLLK